MILSLFLLRRLWRCAVAIIQYCQWIAVFFVPDFKLVQNIKRSAVRSLADSCFLHVLYLLFSLCFTQWGVSSYVIGVNYVVYLGFCQFVFFIRVCECHTLHHCFSFLCCGYHFNVCSLLPFLFSVQGVQPFKFLMHESRGCFKKQRSPWLTRWRFIVHECCWISSWVWFNAFIIL